MGIVFRTIHLVSNSEWLIQVQWVKGRDLGRGKTLMWLHSYEPFSLLALSYFLVKPRVRKRTSSDGIEFFKLHKEASLVQW